MTTNFNYSENALFTQDEKKSLALAADILKSKLTDRKSWELTSPEMVRFFCKCSLASREREVFAIIFLDNKHRVLGTEELFYGTIDSAAVYPREVVKSALSYNCAATVLYHNHPSGVAEPSQADRRITRRIVDALHTVDIRVLDHLVVSYKEMVSFAERGWI